MRKMGWVTNKYPAEDNGKTFQEQYNTIIKLKNCHKKKIDL